MHVNNSPPVNQGQIESYRHARTAVIVAEASCTRKIRNVVIGALLLGAGCAGASGLVRANCVSDNCTFAAQALNTGSIALSITATIVMSFIICK